MGFRHLLVSDLDGTLLGDAAALRRFAAWWRRNRRTTQLVYATGRHPEEIRTAVREEGLPEADFVVAALGTEIVDRRRGELTSWSRRFDPTHGERVRAALRPFEWLQLQPDVHQSPLKASYVAAALGASDLTLIERRLVAAGVDARLIFSGGHYLDVLPAGTGKGPATAFLSATLGVPPALVLTFGDSGNDLDLLAMGFRATVVANAHPEVHAAVSSAVYRSARPFADGVLDGIRYWRRSRSGSADDGALAARVASPAAVE
jgi:sucrose-6F-phosphate phosphohydrolase